MPKPPPNTNDPDENAPPPLAEMDSTDDDDLVTRAFTVSPRLAVPMRDGIPAGPSATVEIARHSEKDLRRPKRLWPLAAFAIVALLAPSAWWFFRPPPEQPPQPPAVNTSALVHWLRPDALIATRPTRLTRVRLSRDDRRALILGFNAELYSALVRMAHGERILIPKRKRGFE